MKIQVKINKKPFDRIQIIRLLKTCDKSLPLKEAKNMVEKEIEHKVANVGDILEFDLPDGSLVNVNIHDYNPKGEFDIIATQGDEIPDKLSLVKTDTDVLKTGMFVLIKDTDEAKWKLDIFSHTENSNFPYVCIADRYAKCIPYEGNEHLLNTSNPANSLPTDPEPKLPTYDNEKKRYRVVFGNGVVDYTDQELYNFITGAVLHNRDIRVFIVVDTKNMPSRE